MVGREKTFSGLPWTRSRRAGRLCRCRPARAPAILGCHLLCCLFAVTCESLVSREFSRIILKFHFSISISRHFHFTFHSRSRFQGLFISLFILDLDFKAFSFHFSLSKWVKGKQISLFISRKEWKHFRFHSFSREKKSEKKRSKKDKKKEQKKKTWKGAKKKKKRSKHKCSVFWPLAQHSLLLLHLRPETNLCP